MAAEPLQPSPTRCRHIWPMAAVHHVFGPRSANDDVRRRLWNRTPIRPFEVGNGDADMGNVSATIRWPPVWLFALENAADDPALDPVGRAVRRR